MNSDRIYSPQDFEHVSPSLYRLVVVAMRRAAQLAKPDSRALIPRNSKKATIVALDEILEGKVVCGVSNTDEEDYFH